MTIKASGTLSFKNDIVAEFIDTAPHSLSEFYGKDVKIPKSGTISFSHFYGASNTMTNAQLITNIMRSTAYGTVRNVMVSHANFGWSTYKMETNAAQSFTNSASPTNLSNLSSATTINATYTWPATIGAPFDNLSFLTVVIINHSSSCTMVSSITWNGVVYNAVNSYTHRSTSPSPDFDNKISYFHIPVTKNPYAGSKLDVTYKKVSDNVTTMQEAFVLPGKWNALRDYFNVGSSRIDCGAVIPDDLVIATSANGTDGAFDTGSTRAQVINIMKRGLTYDNDILTYMSLVNSSGTLEFDPGADSSDAGSIIIFRLEKA